MDNRENKFIENFENFEGGQVHCHLPLEEDEIMNVEKRG